jgi:uncharacterized protein YvpB
LTNASHRRRRATAVALIVLVAVTAIVVTATVNGSEPIASVTVLVKGRPALKVRRLDDMGKPRARADIAASLPRSVHVRAGRVSTTFALDRDQVAARVAGATDPRLAVAGRPTAARIDAPVVAQKLRNNCETAALEILLATAGVRADQLELQTQLDRSGPLDPEGQEPDEVWGDPDEGYVGRADGTGPAGGFGVYPRPVARLAARLGRKLDDLTGASIAALRRRILAGGAVMVWIGLGDGPYWSWTSPTGREIRVNLNEHTIVLVGVRRTGDFEAINVLEGTREVLTPDELAAAWDLLGRRALAAA